MPEWEVCRIVLTRHYRPERDCWEARQTTSQGEVVIGQSADARVPGISAIFQSKKLDDFEQQREAAHSQLIAQLVSQGWEPVSTDAQGHVSMMKRAKS